MKEVKEGLLLTQNQYELVECVDAYIHGFNSTHRNKEAKENRILFMMLQG